MKEIEPIELKAMIDAKEDFQLIDVREPHEYDLVNIAGELIPMGEIPENLSKIARDKKVIVMCRSGKRSATITRFLEENGMEKVYNLRGGILAYSDDIDPSLPQY